MSEYTSERIILMEKLQVDCGLKAASTLEEIITSAKKLSDMRVSLLLGVSSHRNGRAD